MYYKLGIFEQYGDEKQGNLMVWWFRLEGVESEHYIIQYS